MSSALKIVRRRIKTLAKKGCKEKSERLEKLLETSCEFCDNDTKVSAIWMFRKHPALGGKTIIACCATEKSFQDATKYIGQLNDGTFP